MSVRIQIEVTRAGAPYFSGSFSRAPITVGSADDNDVVLQSADVTACHGVVTLSDAGLCFEDTSREGAFLGDLPIEGQAELGVRGILKIPPFELDVRLRSNAPESSFERFKTNADWPESFDTPDTRPIIEPMDLPEPPEDLGSAEDQDPLPAFIVVDGPAHLRGERIEIPDRDEVVVGRSERADVRLADRAISRRHAALRRDDEGRLHLVDLGSVNGLFLNGDQIESEALEDGDEIRMGTLALVFSFWPVNGTPVSMPRLPAVVIESNAEGRPAIIGLRGEVAGVDADNLAAMLEEILAVPGNRWLVVDAEHSHAIGAAALASLAAAHARLADRGGGLLLAGLRTSQATRLSENRLAGTLDICRVRDRDEAFQRVGG